MFTSETHVRLLLFDNSIGNFWLIFEESPPPHDTLQNILKIQNCYVIKNLNVECSVDAGIHGIWSLHQALGEWKRSGGVYGNDLMDMRFNKPQRWLYLKIDH